jgi:hypothetical protein
VSITSPENGATVRSPFGLSTEADGFTIEPAGQVRAGAGHLHLMVDTGCVAPGEAIPEDAQHLHFGDGSTERELDLPMGEHTVCLQAGDGAHNALHLIDQITITVVGPGGIGGETAPEEATGAEAWEGSWEGTTVITGETPGSCEYELEGTFDITVDTDGTATMEGADTFAGSCVGQPVPSFTRDFVAIGERTPSGFRFEDLPLSGPGSIPSVTIEVTGEEGTGRYQGPSGEGHGSTTLDFVVKCRSCWT